MPFIDIAVYFVIAILGLAYPVSLQVLSRLDEKYASVNILSRFEKEIWGKVFTRALFSSLIAVLAHIIWKTTLKLKCNSNEICYILPDYILLLVVTVLVFSFLLYIRKIFIYYSPYRLVEYLKAQKDNDEYHEFKSLADIFYLSIRLKDASLSQTLHTFFYERFREIRTAAGEEEVIYPAAFYQMAYNALIEAGEQNSRKTKNLALNIASGRYYLGEHKYTRVSVLTFAWIWNNLKFIAEIKNDDFAFEYWTNSHQFISSALPYISLKSNRDDPFEILNVAEVNQRETERDKFYEFHFAFGGMLLYAQSYKLLNRIFRHTMSIPPSYELLPATMTTVFTLFVRFRSPDFRTFPYPYHFYQSEGIAGEGLSQNWICKYIALTLLRQYTITSYYYGHNPIDLPNLPASRAERQQWLDAMEFLKSCIRDIQGEKELMETTGFSIITDEWCAAQKILPPISLVNEVIKRLTIALSTQEIEQALSKEKVGQFQERSAQIVNTRINAYAKLINPVHTKSKYQISHINGAIDLIKKEAFADEQGITYLDFDTRLANKLAGKITKEFTDGIFAGIKNSYLFKAPELFMAIANLKPDPQKHILLNFGIHIPTVTAQYKIDELSSDSYQKIKILDVPFFDRNTIHSSLLLIKKENLPSFKIENPQPDEIQKFDLQPINRSISLFAAIIDLNEQPHFKELFGNISDATLNVSVLMKLAIDFQMLWPKSPETVQFKLYSEFYEQGIPNKLSDLKKL